MSREPNKALEGILEEAADSLFRPTPEMQQWKAKYWAGALSIDEATPDVADVVRVVGSDKVRQHWGKPGFQEWFLNKESFKWKLEYLFDKATDAMEEILDNRDPKAQSARVNVIKLISELASKMPKPEEKDNLSKQLGTMDRVQIDAWLEKQGQKVQISASKGSKINEAEVVDVKAD